MARSKARPWRNLALLCGFVVFALAFVPDSAELPGHRPIQHLALGALIAIAVGATVEQMRRPIAPGSKGRQDAERVYASQKRAGLVIGAVLWVLLVLGALHGQFHDMGGWLLLPVACAGPGLYLRDRWLRRA